MIDNFKVSSTALGRRFSVLVHVYETMAELQAAGAAFDGGDYSDAAGLCHCFGFTYGDAPQLLALVRLSKDVVSDKIVIHEMAHAAMHVYEAGRVRPYSLATKHLHGSNEPFAYLSGDLTVAVVNQLSRRGHW